MGLATMSGGNAPGTEGFEAWWDAWFPPRSGGLRLPEAAALRVFCEEIWDAARRRHTVYREGSFDDWWDGPEAQAARHVGASPRELAAYAYSAATWHTQRQDAAALEAAQPRREGAD